MLRNKQEQKLKYLRRLDERMGELGYREVEYVPVEKPYQIGWTIHIALSESGKRRRDAPDLQKVLDICGASKKEYTRSLKFLRYIRMCRRVGVAHEITNNTPYKTRAAWPYWFRGIGDYHIDRHQYLNLPYAIRKYFTPDIYYKYSYWTGKENHQTKYHIRLWQFPLYELVYKVEKCFASHQGVPKGDDWGEYERIRDILSNNHYWCSKNGYSGGWNHTKDMIYLRLERRKWKQFCHSMKNSDFSYEHEMVAMKHFCNTKYKW
jgi:hypothetical protein